MVVSNGHAYYELLQQNLSMESIACFVHLGWNECWLSDCRDLWESGWRKTLRSHLECICSGQRTICAGLHCHEEAFRMEKFLPRWLLWPVGRFFSETGETQLCVVTHKDIKGTFCPRGCHKGFATWISWNRVKFLQAVMLTWDCSRTWSKPRVVLLSVSSPYK